MKLLACALVIISVPASAMLRAPVRCAAVSNQHARSYASRSPYVQLVSLPKDRRGIVKALRDAQATHDDWYRTYKICKEFRHLDKEFKCLDENRCKQQREIFRQHNLPAKLSKTPTCEIAVPAAAAIIEICCERLNS